MRRKPRRPKRKRREPKRLAEQEQEQEQGGREGLDDRFTSPLLPSTPPRSAEEIGPASPPYPPSPAVPPRLTVPPDCQALSSNGDS